MLLPSVDLLKRMGLAVGGLFFEKIRNNDVPVLVAKLPSHIIKAILNGVTVSIIFGVYEVDFVHVCCLGLVVDDDPAQPIVFSHSLSNNELEQIKLLKKALVHVSNKIYFLDELCRPVVSADCHVTQAYVNELITFLDSSSKELIYITQDIGEIALNYFTKSLDEIQKGNDPNAILFGKIELDVILGETNILRHIKTDEFKIDQANEGQGLEQTIHQNLVELYPNNIYHNPIVTEESKSRELTDILAFEDDHICLFESKALSVLAKEESLSTKRIVSNIRKDIRKGIKQLKGAVKNIKADMPIYSKDDERLNVPTEVEEIHGFIIISEMHPEIDWEWVADEIFKLAKERKIILQVVDLMELSIIVRGSGKSNLFRLNLYTRWEKVIENGSAFIRSRKKSAD